MDQHDPEGAFAAVSGVRRLISERMSLLRRQRRETDDPQERFRLERRLLELRPMLTQMNQLAELTAHYYERGYDRDGHYTL